MSKNFCINPKVVNYTQHWSTIQSKYVDKLLFNQKTNLYEPYYSLPCGKCIKCQKKYSAEWALRLKHEATLHKENCFITFTYNPENLPDNATLIPSHINTFINSLRHKISREDKVKNEKIKDKSKHIHRNIRYFLCGEYGDKSNKKITPYGRPNYHVVIFGWQPEDKDLIYFKNNKAGTALYQSPLIENLWNKGFISVGLDMDVKSLIYVTKYMTKLQKYDYRNYPPFVRMSNRPGIGAGWLAEYEKDGRKIIYKKLKHNIYKNDVIYDNGFSKKPPRYYDKIAEKVGINMETIKERRGEYASLAGLQLPSLVHKQQYYYGLQMDGHEISHLWLPKQEVLQKIKNYSDEKYKLWLTQFKEVEIPKQVKIWYAGQKIISKEDYLSKVDYDWYLTEKRLKSNIENVPRKKIEERELHFYPGYKRDGSDYYKRKW